MSKGTKLILATIFALIGCSCKDANVAVVKPKELQVPVEVTGEPDAWEIARIWKTSEGQTVLLSPANRWGPEEWGVMLSDLAQHVANSKNLNKGTDKADFLKKLKKQLDKEWQSPTDTMEGRLMND